MIVFTGYAECLRAPFRLVGSAAWLEWRTRFPGYAVKDLLVPGDTIVLADGTSTIIVWDGTAWRQQGD